MVLGKGVGLIVRFDTSLKSSNHSQLAEAALAVLLVRVENIFCAHAHTLLNS